MSSAPSTRRLREHRNGVASAAPKTSPSLIKSARTLASNPISSQSPASSNPRPNPRAAQRPALRPVPAVDKSAVAGPGSAGRQSTSSVPRGRSSSPSEFIRVFRDSLKRGESGSCNNRVVLSAGKKSGSTKFSDSKENAGFGAESGKKVVAFNAKGFEVEEKEGDLSGCKVLNGHFIKEVGLGSNLVKSSEVNDVGNLDLCLKGCNRSGLRSNCLTSSGEGSCGNVKVMERVKEKSLSDEGVRSRLGVQYPSKLHEKLAFLEGKVKRIASDIKKTKEMLDMNNPDASKVILLDIQDKISGIEKAMGHVGSEPLKSGGDDSGEKMVVEESGTKEVDEAKGSIKRLNSEELEARLFPHHKLLRNRASSKVLSGCSQVNSESETIEASKSSEFKVEEELLSPIEENSIAQKFFTSLNEEEAKTALRDAKLGDNSCEVQESNGAAGLGKIDLSSAFNAENVEELVLTTDEKLDDFDNQENRQVFAMDEEIEDSPVYQLNEIGSKNSTAGWFMSEGESVLLAHDDGSCTFYDIANCEEKIVYKPPVGLLPNIWADCWIVRAPGADGCSGKYVVAASAGNSVHSGFCSWDFYNKDVQAFHMEDGELTTIKTVLAPLPSTTTHRRNALSGMLPPDTRQWWYRPCGPLIISTSSTQRMVKLFDIRDGEKIMEWEVQKPVPSMDYSSPLQWRNKGKVVVTETETVSVWDVNALNAQPLLSVSSSGRRISALHVINTDAELGGGVRQRVTSAEAEGNDGVFCTADSINILDFRHPSGIGLKIPKIGCTMQSVYTRGDSVYIGCSKMQSAGKNQPSFQVQHLSLRNQKLVCTYSLPDSDSHSQHSAITQVWGNSNLVMATSGLGLFVFDALKDDVTQAFAVDNGNTKEVREVIGPDDLYSPSFDYLASRILLVSKHRPALWRVVL